MEMAKRPRSPSYPRSGLRETIARVRKIKDLHAQTDIEREAACLAMGYTTSKSGAAQGSLSAALAYGLLETRGKGSVGVSKAGMIVLVGEEPARSEALREAAQAPSLHQKLNDHFAGDAIPSQRTIEAHLEIEGFTKGAATTAAKQYIEAIDFAGQKSVNESGGGFVGQPTSVAEAQPEGGPMPMSTATGFQTQLRGKLPDGNEFALNTREPISLTILAEVLEVFSRTKSEPPVESQEPVKEDDAPSFDD